MNDLQPLVSICCLSYNHAPFIRKCLDGFLMQETTFPVEILIHDDASTDGTDDIVREYAKKFPDKIFPLFEEENKYSHGFKGKMDFFNYNRARGKYIATCEGDDYWTDPLKLQKQVDFMEAHPEYSVCFHNCHFYDVRQEKVAYPKGYHFLNADQIGTEITLDDYFHKGLVQPLTMLFRLSMFDFGWHDRYQYYRDTHEISHLLKAGKGFWMNFDGGVYTQHAGGISTSTSIEERCWEVREQLLELYLDLGDKVLANYLTEILLWNYDTYANNGDVRSFHDMMRTFRKAVPKIARKVYFVIAKRKLKKRIRKSLLHLRLRPIKVFCFHQVSETCNPLSMCDWTRLDQFKKNILELKKKYVFISLQDAREKLGKDVFRFCKYAVLTADDGYRSLLNVLPWLEEQKIPITLFVNTKCLEEKACPDLYLSLDELFQLNSSWITVGLHGHEHLDPLEQKEKDFYNNVKMNQDVLKSHPKYVPFFAYPWGKHSETLDNIVKNLGLTPVIVTGSNNYDNPNCIDRICIDRIAL